MTPPFVPPFIVPTFIKWAFALWVPLTLLLLVLKSHLKFKREENKAAIAAAPFSLLFMIFFSWFVGSINTITEFYLPALFYSRWIALVSFALAIVLFFIRKHAKWLYALIEISGACLALYVSAIPSAIPVTQRAVTLVGAIYFLIRGLDNAEQGRLPQKLGEAIRLFPRHYVRLLTAAVVAGLVITVGIASRNRFADVKPPYRSLVKSPMPIPVSPLECGQLWVVCDEGSWRERDRLLAGSAAERAAAEGTAEARRNALRSQLEPLR